MPTQTTWHDLLAKPEPDSILAWAMDFPWAKAMEDCPQEEEWHAEGDVWTHSCLVVAECARLAEWPSLAPHQRLTLLLAALLHDCGKPATTRFDEESQRLRSIGHSRVGSNIARQTLRELGAPLREREEIAQLVLAHGRPPFFMRQEWPEGDVIKQSLTCHLPMLLRLCWADTRGRKSEQDSSQVEGALRLYEETAQQLGCWQQAYPFANEQARSLFARGKLSDLHYTPRAPEGSRVIMLAGPPGAGKDTFIANRFATLPVVSLDSLREELDVSPTGNQGAVIQLAKEHCRVHLREQESFIFNATNLTRDLRQRWLGLFHDYAAHITIIYLEPPLREILRRNKQRDADVPESVIRKLLPKAEPPTLLEAHQVELVDF